MSEFTGLRFPRVSPRARAALERHGGTVARLRKQGPRTWAVVVPVACATWTTDDDGTLRHELPGGATLLFRPGGPGLVHARDEATEPPR